jgi:hypothetical protein
MVKLIEVNEAFARRQQVAERQMTRVHVRAQHLWEQYIDGLVTDGQDIDRELEAAAARLNHRLKELEEGLSQERRQRAREALALLTPAQRDVLATFAPCFVPPRNLRDPVRVGQSRSSERAERLVQQLVDLPDQTYRRRRNRIVRQMLEKTQERYGELDAADCQAEEQRLLTILDQVHAMDPVEAALELDQVVSELHPRHPIHQAKLYREGHELEAQALRKAAQFLMAPEFGRLLARKHQAILGRPGTAPVDLTSVEAAENCKDGACALEEEEAVPPRRKQRGAGPRQP